MSLNMITGVRDLDRYLILNFVNPEDYLSLLLTNKYICSLFDDIFFRVKLLKEFNFVCSSEKGRNEKDIYSVVYYFNKICNILNETDKWAKSISITCENTKDKFWSKKTIINTFGVKIYYSDNRDEISLFMGLTYSPVLFTTNLNQNYKYEHPDGTKIEYCKFKVSKIRYADIPKSFPFTDNFIFTLQNEK